MPKLKAKERGSVTRTNLRKTRPPKLLPALTILKETKLIKNSPSSNIPIIRPGMWARCAMNSEKSPPLGSPRIPMTKLG
ncbi:hypothetical protein APHAL10511_004971 [Amanita phalloides]|nr:hypothetical protein APHAL10511_004971 [Amanita phalloides]